MAGGINSSVIGRNRNHGGDVTDAGSRRRSWRKPVNKRNRRISGRQRNQRMAATVSVSAMYHRKHGDINGINWHGGEKKKRNGVTPAAAKSKMAAYGKRQPASAKNGVENHAA